MRTESLREFIELARCLSFSTAAKRLYISQPALSNHISLLEKELGVTLIERDESMRLTAAGRVFLEDITSAVSQIDKAIAHCRDFSKQAQGKITIKSPIDLQKNSSFLLKSVESFKRNNPNIDVEMKSESNRYLFNELATNSIDCGLVYGPVDNIEGVSYSSFSIGTNRMLLWVHKDHPLASKKPLTIADLDGSSYPLPSNAQFYEFQHGLETFFATYGVSPDFYYRSCDSFIDFLLSCGTDDVLLGTTGIESNPILSLKEGDLFREIHDLGDMPAYIAFGATNSNPVLPLFLDHLNEMAQEMSKENTPISKSNTPTTKSQRAE